MEHAPLILTLKLDAASFQRFDALRVRWFPPAANHIPAHLTLFHRLPGDRLDQLVREIAERRAAVMPLHVTGVRRLGRGVAYEVAGEPLTRLQGELAGLWKAHLTPQDRQAFRPHVTIQNKVEPAAADALFGALRSDFRPFDLTGEGLLVWRYLGGPWELAAEIDFTRGP